MSARGAFERVVRHGTFPLLTFGPAALVLALLGADAASPESPSRAVLLSGVLIIAATYAVLAVLERLVPHRDDWNHPKNDLRTDVAYLVFLGPMSALAGGLAATGLARGVHHALPDALCLRLWPTHWHGAAQVLLACLLAEVGHYAIHRLGHERPLLWRLHAVHHSARRLYWLNATRFHPLDLMLVAFLQVLPLEVLGIPPGIYLAYFVASSCYGQLQHCNVDLDTRAYAWLFATPELHRWHHSRHPHEGNTNYGAILIVWDWLFRTRFWPGAPIAEAVGIGDLLRFPDGVVDQLLAPFRWSRITKRASADSKATALDTETDASPS